MVCFNKAANSLQGRIQTKKKRWEAANNHDILLQNLIKTGVIDGMTPKAVHSVFFVDYIFETFVPFYNRYWDQMAREGPAAVRSLGDDKNSSHDASDSEEEYEARRRLETMNLNVGNRSNNVLHLSGISKFPNSFHFLYKMTSPFLDEALRNSVTIEIEMSYTSPKSLSFSLSEDRLSLVGTYELPRISVDVDHRNQQMFGTRFMPRDSRSLAQKQTTKEWMGYKYGSHNHKIDIEPIRLPFRATERFTGRVNPCFSIVKHFKEIHYMIYVFELVEDSAEIGNHASRGTVERDTYSVDDLTVQDLDCLTGRPIDFFGNDIDSTVLEEWYTPQSSLSATVREPETLHAQIPHTISSPMILSNKTDDSVIQETISRFANAQSSMAEAATTQQYMEEHKHEDFASEKKRKKKSSLLGGSTVSGDIQVQTVYSPGSDNVSPVTKKKAQSNMAEGEY